jgi:linoleate 8R-lipoxygenase / 9,12-octadecadienoate 8-hydroperoxide 8R-isomerase
LGPLYGTNQTDQDAVRAFVDGQLKPDTFSETRILGFPPGVSAFLICFNRFHNYIVGEMAQINEGGRFSKPVLADIQATVQATMPTATKDQITAEAKKRYDAAVAKRDNDLFQTGRL